MKQVRNIWLPDGEKHIADQIKTNPIYDGAGTYQRNKYLAALPFLSRKGHALDVGAHVGLWSRLMALDFDKLSAIEPLAIHRECFMRNVRGDVTLYPFAAGAKVGKAGINVEPGNTGSSHLVDGESVDVVTVDSLELGHVDFIKIDVEGREYDVIEGAAMTIMESRPVMVVEQKEGNAERYGRGQTDAVELLKSWGMREARVIGGDYVMVWGSA